MYITKIIVDHAYYIDNANTSMNTCIPKTH